MTDPISRLNARLKDRYAGERELGEGGTATVCHAPSSLVLLAPLLFGACGGLGSDSALTADVPLKLQEHVDAATVVGSEVPADRPQPVEWQFDEPQPEWTPYGNPGSPPVLLCYPRCGPPK